MKKTKVLLLFSILLLLIPVIPTQAAAKKTTVGISSAFVEKTGAALLGVFISSDEKIAGGSFDIVYDPDKIRLNERDVSMTNALSDYLTSSNNTADGVLSLSFAKSSGSVLDDVVIDLKPYVQTAGSGEKNSLSLENVELYNDKGERIDTKLIDGEVKPFVGEEKSHAETVDGNKDWVITLSGDYNPATLNKQAISMKRGSTVIDVEVEAINSRQFRVKPVGVYTQGMYTMDITDQLRSSFGKKLSQPVRFTFKVK